MEGMRASFNQKLILKMKEKYMQKKNRCIFSVVCSNTIVLIKNVVLFYDDNMMNKTNMRDYK